jgi:hypothetical protein
VHATSVDTLTASFGSCCSLFTYSKGKHHHPKCELYRRPQLDADLFTAHPEPPAPPPVAEVPLHPDICANNHGGNPESEAANKITDKTADAQRLADWYIARGARGGYMELAARELGMRHQTVSARQSDLKRLGVLWKTTQRTQTSSGAKAGVYVHHNFAAMVELDPQQRRTPKA